MPRLPSTIPAFCTRAPSSVPHGPRLWCVTSSPKAQLTAVLVFLSTFFLSAVGSEFSDTHNEEVAVDPSASIKTEQRIVFASTADGLREQVEALLHENRLLTAKLRNHEQTYRLQKAGANDKKKEPALASVTASTSSAPTSFIEYMVTTSSGNTTQPAVEEYQNQGTGSSASPAFSAAQKTTNGREDEEEEATEVSNLLDLLVRNEQIRVAAELRLEEAASKRKLAEHRERVAQRELDNVDQVSKGVVDMLMQQLKKTTSLFFSWLEEAGNDFVDTLITHMIQEFNLRDKNGDLVLDKGECPKPPDGADLNEDDKLTPVEALAYLLQNITQDAGNVVPGEATTKDKAQSGQGSLLELAQHQSSWRTFWSDCWRNSMCGVDEAEASFEEAGASSETGETESSVGDVRRRESFSDLCGMCGCPERPDRKTEMEELEEWDRRRYRPPPYGYEPFPLDPMDAGARSMRMN
ncbi:unnamed protein product [Amoebophrya sp. A120]|nr:unnamed protein product [Amoebophrya sp. A120]|eukprot:GSA120T00012953001.1